MMTLLKSILNDCGFTYQDAADHMTDRLGRKISAQTLKMMSRGKSNINPDIIKCLTDYYQDITALSRSKDITLIIRKMKTCDQDTMFSDKSYDDRTLKAISRALLR